MDFFEKKFAVFIKMKTSLNYTAGHFLHDTSKTVPRTLKNCKIFDKYLLNGIYVKSGNLHHAKFHA